jgi:hypothetical protein
MIELDQYAKRIGYLFDGDVVTYKLEKKVDQDLLKKFEFY